MQESIKDLILHSMKEKVHFLRANLSKVVSEGMTLKGHLFGSMAKIHKLEATLKSFKDVITQFQKENEELKVSHKAEVAKFDEALKAKEVKIYDRKASV